MAWNDLLPNLPSSVGGVISAGINYFSNRAANRENVALAQMQNQWNIDQWNRENFYNRPDQQMARLKAAGLNPNLVFANGDMMNEAASSPQMTSGAGMVRPYQIDPLTAAQISNLNAQTEKTRSETETIEQTRASIIDQLDSQVDLNRKSIENLQSQIEQRVKQNDLTDAQISKIKFDRMMEGKRYMLDKDRLKHENNLTDQQAEQCVAEIKRILAEKRVTDREYQEMIWTFSIRKSGLEAAVGLTEAQTKSANATARKLGFEGDLLEGPAFNEKGYAESLRGDHGVVNFIAANIRSGVQMVTRDFGNIFGIFK